MLESFFKQFKPMLVRRKETIAGSSDLNHVYYINQGYIRMYTVSESGGEVTLYIFSPSTIFPILWNKNPVLGQYYFESLTPAEIFSVEKNKLQQFMVQKPEVCSEIVDQLSSFSHLAIKKLELKILGSAYRQVIFTILDLASHFGQKNKDGLVVAYWFTHQDIASLTGLSRERVTIEINNLQNKKLICYSSHFMTIPKLQSLESELE